MPFVSQAQRRYMYDQHPELAREFEAATPKGAKLPQHVRKYAGGGSMMAGKPMMNEAMMDRNEKAEMRRMNMNRGRLPGLQKLPRNARRGRGATMNMNMMQK